MNILKKIFGWLVDNSFNFLMLGAVCLIGWGSFVRSHSPYIDCQIVTSAPTCNKYGCRAVFESGRHGSINTLVIAGDLVCADRFMKDYYEFPNTKKELP